MGLAQVRTVGAGELTAGWRAGVGTGTVDAHGHVDVPWIAAVSGRSSLVGMLRYDECRLAENWRSRKSANGLTKVALLDTGLHGGPAQALLFRPTTPAERHALPVDGWWDARAAVGRPYRCQPWNDGPANHYGKAANGLAAVAWSSVQLPGRQLADSALQGFAVADTTPGRFVRPRGHDFM